MSSFTCALMVSTLDEIFSLSDRVGVIFRGKMVASLPTVEADREEIGLFMGRGMNKDG